MRMALNSGSAISREKKQSNRVHKQSNASDRVRSRSKGCVSLGPGPTGVGV
jgi:hypothetical protein